LETGSGPFGGTGSWPFGGNSVLAKMDKAGKTSAGLATDRVFHIMGGLGQVAQLVEHRTENPGVAGSIPALSTPTLSTAETSPRPRCRPEAVATQRRPVTGKIAEDVKPFLEGAMVGRFGAVLCESLRNEPPGR
jgi:hypothetical protein